MPLASTDRDTRIYQSTALCSHKRQRDTTHLFLDLVQEGLGTRARDRAEVLDQLALGHADTRVGNGQRVLRLVRRDCDLGFELRVDNRLASRLQVAQLLERVRGVRNELAHKHFLVRVDRVRHNVQQLPRLGLELVAVGCDTHHHRVQYEHRVRAGVSAGRQDVPLSGELLVLMAMVSMCCSAACGTRLVACCSATAWRGAETRAVTAAVVARSASRKAAARIMVAGQWSKRVVAAKFLEAPPTSHIVPLLFSNDISPDAATRSDTLISLSLVTSASSTRPDSAITMGVLLCGDAPPYPMEGPLTTSGPSILWGTIAPAQRKCRRQEHHC
jgi:hypothetical protein